METTTVSKHFGPSAQDDMDKDWCPVCESVTRYDGERCACCGRVWGYESERYACTDPVADPETPFTDH